MTQLIVIIVYLSLLLALGLASNRLFRGTKSDYMLASHSIGPFLLLMSIFGTTMTAFALVGSSGEAFKEGIGVYGMLASSSGILHSLCFFVVGIKVWKLGRRYGYSTQIGFFRDRLESPGIGLFLFPVLVGLVIPYLLIGVISSGVVIQGLTAGAFPDFAPFITDSRATSGGVPPWLGSLCICMVVLLYVFFGGMRGTAWANAFQTIVFMILGVLTFCVIASKLGGEASLLANLKKLGEALPLEKATRAEMSKTKFFTYMLIPLSVGMFPHLFQHWLTAKSAKSFKLPIVVHPIFIMLVWVPCVLIGVWATTHLVPAVPPLPKKNPNAILAFLVKTQTAPWLGGLLAAGILAAIMSSLDSQFLCLGTMFTEDIVSHYFGRDRYSDRQMVWIARGFIVAIVVITYLIFLYLQFQGISKSVFTLAVWCFTGFASLFPLITASIYWKRLTAPGAIAGILAMISSWAYFFYQSGFGQKRGFTVDISLGGKVYQTMPVASILLLSLITMFVVSLLTKPPSEKTLNRFF